MTFAGRLTENAAHIEARLDRMLSPPEADGVPARLLAAMRHAVLGAGKRVRPALVIECAALFGVAREAAADCACAFELMHCYSLVHDDLPAMDDDAVRRGQPTVHVAFGEWTAILAGDALQAMAFDVLASEAACADPTARAALVSVLARAAGPRGMAGGQYLDLEAETLGTRFGAEGVARLQAMKTGALIRAACEAGAVLGGAAEGERRALALFGAEMGSMFQMVDDVIDATGEAAQVGKATAKDAAKGKATLVSLFGLEEARRRVEDAEARALAALAPFGARAAVLAGGVRHIARRKK